LATPRFTTQDIENGYFAAPVNDPGELVFITKESTAGVVSSRWHEGIKLTLNNGGDVVPGPGLEKLSWQKGMERLNDITLGFDAEFVGAVFDKNAPFIAALKARHTKLVGEGNATALRDVVASGPYHPSEALGGQVQYAQGPGPRKLQQG
jgi:hypothetical protein